MSEPIRVALLGAGDRGMNNFGEFALRFPHLMKIVAVAEPNEEKRFLFAKKHNLQTDQLFTSWEVVFAKPQLAETLINALPDRLHYAATNQALNFNYHILVMLFFLKKQGSPKFFLELRGSPLLPQAPFLFEWHFS